MDLKNNQSGFQDLNSRQAIPRNSTYPVIFFRITDKIIQNTHDLYFFVKTPPRRTRTDSINEFDTNISILIIALKVNTQCSSAGLIDIYIIITFLSILDKDIYIMTRRFVLAPRRAGRWKVWSGDVLSAQCCSADTEVSLRA